MGGETRTGSSAINWPGLWRLWELPVHAIYSPLQSFLLLLFLNNSGQSDQSEVPRHVLTVSDWHTEGQPFLKQPHNPNQETQELTWHQRKTENKSVFCLVFLLRAVKKTNLCLCSRIEKKPSEGWPSFKKDGFLKPVWVYLLCLCPFQHGECLCKCVSVFTR